MQRVCQLNEHLHWRYDWRWCTQIQEQPLQACVFRWGHSPTCSPLATCLKSYKPPLICCGTRAEGPRWAQGHCPRLGSPWRCRRPLRAGTRSPLPWDLGEPWVKRPLLESGPLDCLTGPGLAQSRSRVLGLPLSSGPGLIHTWTSSVWMGLNEPSIGHSVTILEYRCRFSDLLLCTEK